MKKLPVSVNSVAIAKAKLRAIRYAERRLMRRLEDIEWQNTWLKDELDRVDELAATGKVPEFGIVPSTIKALKPAKRTDEPNN